MQEIWKDIKDYEGYYQVSNLGRVKSLKKFNCTNKVYKNIGYYRNEKYLKLIKNNNGYYQVSLSKNSKSKIHFVHKLVAEAFLENKNNYLYVNHKDENKLNNNVNNLEWCSQKYNCNYGTRNDRIANKLKIKVLQYDMNGNFIKEWKSATDVEKELKINRMHIGSCINNNRKTAGGFIWKKV